MSDSRPGVWSLVAIPALLTLLVTVVRLIGELQGWNPALFSAEAGGGGSAVGITWLALLFGFYFGWRLRRTTNLPERVSRSAILYVVAIAVAAGAIAGLIRTELVVLPSEAAPGALQGGGYLLVVLGLAAVIALIAWPRLTLVLMFYGVLARLPVIVVTYLDLQQGWNTHYGALPPGVPEMGMTETFWGLVTPQLTLWPFAWTPIAGGLAGCLGGALAGTRTRI